MSVDWKDTTQPRRGYVVDHRVLKLGDVDLRGEPLHRRKKLLEKSLPENPRLLYVEHMEPEGLAMFAGALALGLERVIAKDSKTPTLWHWQKIKNREYQRKEKVEFKQRGRR